MVLNAKPILHKKGDSNACIRLVEPTPIKYRTKIIILMALLHAFTLLSLYKLGQMKILTLLYTLLLTYLAAFGTTAGAHRMCSHKAYKAKEPLRLILFACFALASHLNLYVWVRTHRLHHKYTDTEADPHNATRGFWFAHIGWLLVDKTPECRQAEKEIDMSDIVEEPFAKFHTRWFYPTSFSLLFLPALIPVYLWGENIWLSLLSTGALRYAWNLHITLSVNSFAHMFGSRPYDKRILPTEGAIISLFSLGEGWHNYHHTFPWDYKAAEFGDRFNLTARALDLFAKVGWAYDLRTASPQLIAMTKEKHGKSSDPNRNDKENEEQQ